MRAIALPPPGPGWEIALDRAEQVGAGAVRVALSWTRGVDDESAFDDWGRALDACHDRGLVPIVDLGAVGVPGGDGRIWREPGIVDRFVTWSSTVADRLAGRTRHWVTVPSPALVAVENWLEGLAAFGGRLDVAATIRTVDHLLAAHVAVHEAIHRRQPQAVVALLHHPFPVYELDGLLLDVLTSRHRAVGRYDLPEWLAAQRAAIAPTAGLPALGVRRWARNAIPMEKALPRLIAAVHASEHDRPFDALHLEAGHVDALHHFRRGGRSRTAAGAAADPSSIDDRRGRLLATGVPVWLVAGGCAGLHLADAEARAGALRDRGVDVVGLVVDEGSR